MCMLREVPHIYYLIRQGAWPHIIMVWGFYKMLITKGYNQRKDGDILFSGQM